MKKILTIVALSLFCIALKKPEEKPLFATRYIATTGNDANPCTEAQPCYNLEYVWGLSSNNDVIILAPGTYTVSAAYKPTSQVNRIYLSGKNNITINGLGAIYNLGDPDIPGSAGDGAVGMKIENCSGLHIIGIRITGLEQPVAGNNIPAGFIAVNMDNSTLERMEVDNIQGYGYYFQNGSDNNTILNCDAHHLGDLYTSSGIYENSNGFNITGGDASTGNIFDGCRAWWCGDDGFDFFNTNGIHTIKNSWSFWNGFIPGGFTHSPNQDGDGFKLGPAQDNEPPHTTTIRFLERCLAFENWAFGFDQNSNTGNAYKVQMYNCAAYKSGYTTDPVAGFFFGGNTSILQNFKNNISTTGINGSEINSGPNVATNSWNGFTANDADFISVSSVGMDGPRQEDGSLPILNFLRLITGSDLIDAGTNVGLPFNGPAPDLGPFETSVAVPPTQIRLNKRVIVNN